MSFDLAFVNVNCYTLQEERPQVEAVGITKKHIESIGSNDKIQEGISSQTEVIDGKGMTLLPGFSDAHTHFASMGIRISCYFELGEVKDRDELLAVVRKEAQKKNKGEWITGIGWDESKWTGDASFMTRQELDGVAPENPVALTRVDGHICCVNSMALDVLNFPPQTRGVLEVQGEPSGQLVEEAGFQVRQHTEPKGREILPGLKKAIQKAHSLGVTALHDIWVDREKLKAYQYLREEEELKLRVGVFLGDDYLEDLVHLGLFSLGDAYLRLLGVKLFVDGSIGARTAMVEKGYANDPGNKGYPMWEKEELKKLIQRAHVHDIPLAIHAIGDLAVEDALDCLAENPRRELGPQHRLEHLELITLPQIKRMKKLGITASMQPNFTGEWGHPESMYQERFGPEVIKDMNPLRIIQDEGVTLLLGSDGMPFHPLYGIHSAVNPPFPKQRLTPLEALQGYTRSGAGPYPGQIFPGGKADLVLLEGDPLQEPAAIQEMKVLMTIFDGEVVFEE